VADPADAIQHERELREQWQESHEHFHALDKEALVLARKDIDRRLDEMNQFRDQIERERGEFLRRDMYDEQHNVLRNDVDTRLKTLESSKSNLEGRMFAIGAAITFILAVVQIFLYYVSHH
jgi:hypothetical protein